MIRVFQSNFIIQSRRLLLIRAICISAILCYVGWMRAGSVGSAVPEALVPFDKDPFLFYHESLPLSLHCYLSKEPFLST